ncbi:uncharacterized protein ANIA_11339 [Aspergillus nidulans FGSC A4]|uniref:Uncharacterized protein n=1 Tax=Emericella nidulans (strain FGSC A4 / ATCC 38163 / CBS 112.46 / NRRL 194 / M139) TaxID=227321 RepID=C8VNY2_EMENI|nr:hypothetical protein [Aspergillus nidulans FGSC A4]CBF86813.1 TPA: hypothetical protein ANIA_11339 [Aspergillus nidulans FGSC A4]
MRLRTRLGSLRRYPFLDNPRDRDDSDEQRWDSATAPGFQYNSSKKGGMSPRV